MGDCCPREEEARVHVGAEYVVPLFSGVFCYVVDEGGAAATKEEDYVSDAF